MKLLVGLAVFSAIGIAQSDIRGFTAEQAKVQREHERIATAVPDPARLRAYMEKLSAEPHIAGSPASKAVAEYISSELKKMGLDVHLEEFEVLLPYPTKRLLEMTGPTKYVAKMKEPVLAEDSDSGDANQVPTYNSYSASADVTAQLVYVNYGVPEDYEALKKAGIDVKGKIVIARYGKSWRGTKPKVAQENGAIGCLIYSDPHEDGFFQGDVYPKGPFRPLNGVQRGSVMDMPIYAGDPLTPGWASEKGARRLDLKDAATLMKIPVMPISYEDAQALLAALGGAVVPEPWRGALPITYHYGPGPATVHMVTDYDWTSKPIFNVIATIQGVQAKDELVIYGNHHDAWVNGAQDPISGTIVVLETARALAELKKTGWSPRRTIRLALWDAEEFGLIGSTEYAEKHEVELSKALLYLNSDMNGKGALSAGGSPALETFFSQVMRDVLDPVSNSTVLAKSLLRRGKEESAFHLSPLGSGSDYVGFLHHLGVPSINAGFGGEDNGGIYHSIYDSFNWYVKFSDSTFVYGRALAQVMTTAVLRMADAPVVPYEFGPVSKAIRGYVAEMSANKSLDFAALISQVDALDKAAAAYEVVYASASPEAGSKATGSILNAERKLLIGAGLPGRPWYRYSLAAPGLYTGYSAKTLPGIREAYDTKRFDEASSQIAVFTSVLRDYTEAVNEAAKALQAR